MSFACVPLNIRRSLDIHSLPAFDLSSDAGSGYPDYGGYAKPVPALPKAVTKAEKKSYPLQGKAVKAFLDVNRFSSFARHESHVHGEYCVLGIQSIPHH